VTQYLKGDRVRLTARGRAKGSSTYKGKPIHDRLGTVASTPRPGGQSVKVHWDGTKSPEYYHNSFIEHAGLVEWK
jgi:hypothetical protein